MGNNIRKGLVGLLVSAALAVGIGRESRGDTLILISKVPSLTQESYTYLQHKETAEEYQDQFDSFFTEISGSSVDVYSRNSLLNPDRLDWDVRGINSTEPYHVEMAGRNLSSPVNTDLTFWKDAGFENKDIFVDIYKRLTVGQDFSYNLVDNFNLKDFSGSKSIDVDIDNGVIYQNSFYPSYKLEFSFDPVPEPGTLAFLGLGAAALGIGRRLRGRAKLARSETDRQAGIRRR